MNNTPAITSIDSGMLVAVKVKLLASLRELAGSSEVEVEAGSVKEALIRLVEKYPGLKIVVEPSKPEVKAGYIVFVDGVDVRLVDPEEKAREIVILPVNHGGNDITVEKISWEKVENLSEQVSEKIIEDGYRPDVIIGILRGGVIPARILSDMLRVEDMGVLEIKLYKGVGIRGERPYLRQPATLDLTDKSVLIVDDISDSGLTLQLTVQLIDFYMPKEVKTATLYIKPWTNFVPDYYGEITESWVVFPWEKREFEDLLKNSET
jgi:hypoxanthine phosphoribosyltransferase/molybdopterin converting factor small subunit